MKTNRGLAHRVEEWAFGVLVAIALNGCTGWGTCPDNKVITDGDECHGDDLQCPFAMLVVLCDGTKEETVSSCTCTNGKWDCPEPISSCPDQGGNEAGASAGGNGNEAGASAGRGGGEGAGGNGVNAG